MSTTQDGDNVPAQDTTQEPVDDTQDKQQQPDVPPKDTTPDPLTERLKELEGQDDDNSSNVPSQDLNTLDVESLGDEYISAQVSLLKSYLPDLDMNKALGKALEFGDKNLIDGFYIREVAGERAPEVIRHLESLYDNASNRTEELANEIIQLAGGQERWQKAVNAFNAKAGAGVQRIVRELLSSYNQKDYIEAAQVVLNYASTDGAVNQPANLVTPQNAPPSEEDKPLTKSEYVQAISEAQKIKDRHERHRVEEQLATRRAASRRAGIN